MLDVLLQSTVKRGNLTKCELEKMHDLLPGRFIPSCQPDGRYTQVQCHGSTGYCWCVDENGDKLVGTEVRGPDPVCTKCKYH